MRRVLRWLVLFVVALLIVPAIPAVFMAALIIASLRFAFGSGLSTQSGELRGLA